MALSSNWIHSKEVLLSLNDKVKDLLKIGHKLVLVQQHELEKIRATKHKDRYSDYINKLYQHYIVDKLPKTYLLN